jgi:cytochrome c biogenesis protein CcmG/thiol:disulfide interchange protein DsbE
VKHAALLILAATALVCGLTACGDGDGDAPPRTAAATVLTTSGATATPSPALARNAVDANRLAGAGTAALKRRLASLEGHPIVVNQWASWCGPCRFEFAFFAAAVQQHGATVAFVGVDYLDSRDAAQAFLDEQPPGFASIYDRDGKAARAIGGGRVMPTTLFIGPDGRPRHTKLGGYASASELDADIRRYALGGPQP